MKVTTYITQFLKEKGINIVFELQGGMITRILDEIHHQGEIKIVSMHHEQAAAFAADAFSRIKNKPGVALATSGPGATNLITGIGGCFFDSVPLIFITGQVNLNEQKGNNSTRQIGFQETDIVSIVKPITKKAYVIKTAIEIPSVFEEAYHLAISGRPGPVLIDIPMNIQNEDIGLIDIHGQEAIIEKEKTTHASFFQKFYNSLKYSKRPLMLVGRGLRSSGSIEMFKDFVQKCQIPVVTSLLGLDVLEYKHPQRTGFIGTYGNRWANYALGSCDLLLVLGSRLDLRQTGLDVSSFQKDKIIYHIDIEEAELNNRLSNCIVLKSDLLDFFNGVKNISFENKAPIEWIRNIKKIKQAQLDINELDMITGINPNIFIHKLAQMSQLAKVITADVGNNQMWCAQSFELNRNQLFLTSGGMGAMGYSLPAAIGATITMGNAPVVAIAGDGGFQINIQELQTIRRNNLPVKIVILNNHCLGMIRQFQDSYFNSCYQSTVWGYDAPDFSLLAKAYGIDSYSISLPEEIEIGVGKLWENSTQPFLLEVMIDIYTNVYPKIMFGNPITKMEPEK